MTGRVEHIRGQTFHGRKGALENAFRYGVDYLCLDPEAGVPTPALFSRNGRNLTSLHDSDHGGAPGDGRGAAWVRDVLKAHGLDGAANGQILLLAQPRVLGHVFNPVSFWLVHDRGGALRVVIPEVTNTYGDRHSYLCHHDDLRPITRHGTLQATKIFYVSPFQAVEGGYTFRFDIRDDRIGIWIDYTAGNGGLLATLTGRREPLTNTGILRACLARPFGSRRVLGLIHWQALKLWWKGAAFNTRPTPPAEEVSR
ncbi:DUF1365 domain-containing protein [Ovoidimarina sediminis]|uniref:DUF1365 domain-containing protein n=1 Tax=Ovoidimarina sediminis TaxID=3079856 RepID=UPI00290D1578|nr:DUF1365 domain-containing protein [Rhodophyticola sp. MJ-SS7]MDU8942651.1 DUF1365 domain-containing protein [Rhodophyticola sp. MJ-SS7]